MQSGIVPLDHHLGGIQRGRLHLLTGGAGAGKTTACLQFLQVALRAGDAALLITADRSADVASHARCVGLQLESVVRTHRLLVARFGAQFGSNIAAAAPDAVCAELAALIAEVQPSRIVIDPLTPFLGDRPACTAGLQAVVRLLDSSDASTIFTYHEDVSAGYDARLHVVVQHAAAVVHMVRGDDGARRMRVVQARWQSASPELIPAPVKRTRTRKVTA